MPLIHIINCFMFYAVVLPLLREQTVNPVKHVVLYPTCTNALRRISMAPQDLQGLIPSIKRLEYLMPLVALPFFGLRIFTSLRILRRWKIEDTLIVVAFFFALVNFVLTPIGMSCCFRPGRDFPRASRRCPILMDTIARDYMTANVLEQQGDGGPEGVVPFQIFGYGCVPSFALSTGLSKVSVLYYLRNFGGTSGKLFVFIHAAAIITGVYCVVSAMVSMICTSLYRDVRNINSASMNQRCSRNQVILICGLLNSVGDLVVLILPFIILRPLHTTPMRKVSISMVLLSGGLM
ncbi:hypothetical protein RB600_008522 [Gaeumannomyces tritici]